MDFSLTEEQKMIRNAARDFRAECPKSMVREAEAGALGYSPRIWKRMADIGWSGLVIPEEHGGTGGSLLDLGIVFEELGRAACPSPLFSTVALGVLPVMEAGSADLKKKLLPGVAAGEFILTAALGEPEAEYDPRSISVRAASRNGDFSISGKKLFVHNAHVANYMLVVARTAKANHKGEGLTVFVVNGKEPGISLAPLVTIAADKQFEVVFSGVPASSSDILGELDAGWPLIETMLSRATALKCAEVVGIMEEELEMSKRHVFERVQFDRQIGSFQAVQHHLANMLIDVEAARWLAYEALWCLSEKLPATREVAAAKAWASEACQRVATKAQSLHGGIGMDLDYDLHFYFRRAKAFELNLGSAPLHRSVIANELAR